MVPGCSSWCLLANKHAAPAHRPGIHNDICVAHKDTDQATDLRQFSLLCRLVSGHMMTITGGAVVQPCVYSHWLSQWEPFIFDAHRINVP